jgi:hypothetical protein
MSRSTVVRRLTAVIALLAVLFMAAPAVAAAHGSHAVKPPAVSHASLLDQFMAWLASLGYGPAARPQAGSLAKGMTTVAPPGITSQTMNPTDVSVGIDPNGHQ